MAKLKKPEMNKIQDYSFIGDCRSAALVSRNGSMHWLCWPRFDSEPIFAHLLDQTKGYWSITSVLPCEIHRTCTDAGVVQTIFSNPKGKVVLTDVMSVISPQEAKNHLYPEHEIVRKVECLEGQMELQSEFLIEEECHKCLHKNSNTWSVWNLRHGNLILYAPIELNLNQRSLKGCWTIKQGEIFYFSLSFSEESPCVIPACSSARLSFQATQQFWENLTARISYTGPYRDVVTRSAIVLKLMVYSPSGAIIAAPTTSLPERLGGDLNWDYRYCWLRDASLATHAFMNLNLKNEAKSFVNWLLHSTHLSRPRFKVLYDVYGRTPRPEEIRSDFQGYLDSKPVRFGNEAANQRQMDLYGEVIHGAYYVFKNEEKIDHETQRMLRELGEYICAHWQEPDAGMWEVRGKEEYHTHSLLMCWVGLHYLLKFHDLGLLKVDTVRLKTTEERVAQTLHQFAWNKDLESYTSKLRGDEVDANLLLMPWYGFLPFDSMRMRKTYERIKKDLGAPNGLLYRNRGQEEGVFLLCSLWAVEYLARGGGSREEAESLLRKVLSHVNDVGLLSEEADALTGDLLGNFPLTFSHVGLINAIIAIRDREKQEAVFANQREYDELG